MKGRQATTVDREYRIRSAETEYATYCENVRWDDYERASEIPDELFGEDLPR